MELHCNEKNNLKKMIIFQFKRQGAFLNEGVNLHKKRMPTGVSCCRVMHNTHINRKRATSVNNK